MYDLFLMLHTCAASADEISCICHEDGGGGGCPAGKVGWWVGGRHIFVIGLLDLDQSASPKAPRIYQVIVFLLFFQA